MKAIFNFISSIIVFTLAFVFLKWYIKGHFGKYFIFFWLNTIIAFATYFNHKNQIEQEYDHRTGAEVWEANH
jgi:hypothetical protein